MIIISENQTKARLIKKIEEAQEAKSVLKYAGAWLDEQEKAYLSKVKTKTDEPEDKLFYLAAYSFYNNVVSIVNTGEYSAKKLENL